MAKNRRVKSVNAAPAQINNFEDADKILQQLGDLQLAINQAESTAKGKIDEAKNELAETTKPLQQEIKQHVRALEVFAAANKTAFGKARSKKLSFGKLGWRISTSVSTKKTTLELIKKVFSKKEALTYINVKESVDKKALARLTDEQLVSVNARREEKDVFYAEPDLPEAVDYESRFLG